MSFFPHVLTSIYILMVGGSDNCFVMPTNSSTWYSVFQKSVFCTSNICMNDAPNTSHCWIFAIRSEVTESILKSCAHKDVPSPSICPKWPRSVILAVNDNICNVFHCRWSCTTVIPCGKELSSMITWRLASVWLWKYGTKTSSKMVYWCARPFRLSCIVKTFSLQSLEMGSHTITDLSSKRTFYIVPSWMRLAFGSSDTCLANTLLHVPVRSGGL